MGCFNVACSVSNISIGYGDPIVYIPLELADFPEKVGSRNIYLIYLRCFYFPAAFPMKGSYDDYGGIEDIEMNESALFNLNWYKKDPKNHVEINQMWDCREDESPENIVSGMFIHREIYDLLVNKQISESGGKKDLPNRKQLERDYKKMLEETQKAIKMDAEMNMGSARKKHPHLDYTMWLPNDSRYGGLRFRNYRTMKQMAKSCFEKGIMRDALIELYMFEIGMYFVNTFYFPAMNGLQHGNHYMSHRMYDKAMEITERKIHKYEE